MRLPGISGVGAVSGRGFPARRGEGRPYAGGRLENRTQREHFREGRGHGDRAAAVCPQGLVCRPAPAGERIRHVQLRPQEAEGLLRFRQAGRGRRRVPGRRHGRHDGLPDEPHHVLHRTALCRHRRPVCSVRGPGCGQGERLFRADGNGPYPLGHLRSQRADAGGELPALGEPPSQRRPGGTGRGAGARVPPRDGRVRETGLLRHPLRERGVQSVQFRL